MINKVQLTARGDYRFITLEHDEDSKYIDMTFHYRHGIAFASFELEDLENAIKVLKGEYSVG